MNLLDGLRHSIKLANTQFHFVDLHGNSAYSLKSDHKISLHVSLDGPVTLASRTATFRCDLGRGQYAFVPEGHEHIVGCPQPGTIHALPLLAQGARDGTLQALKIGDGQLRSRMLLALIEFDRLKLASVVRLLQELWEERMKNGPVAYDLPPVLSLSGLAQAGTSFGGTMLLEGIAEILLANAVRKQVAKGNAKALLQMRVADTSVSRSLHAIYNDPAKNWTVQELAEEACMSRSSFAAAFVRSVGTTPADYLLQIRMTRAESLMRHTTSNLAHIAGLVGYTSETAFNKAFRRFNGMTPGAWRRSIVSKLGTDP